MPGAWLRPLGSLDILVSRVAFGAGPVSDLLTKSICPYTELQFQTVQRAIDLGINWFDTAATYAEGRSEITLGAILEDIKKPATPIHIATKVRIAPEETSDIRSAILRSVETSLNRLRTSSLTLLQLHNSVTNLRGELPTSLTQSDVLGSRGVLETFQELKSQNLIRSCGLTGIGNPEILKTLLATGEFDTIQTPCHLLNPSAIRPIPTTLPDEDHSRLLQFAAERGIGTFAIRLLAGGALANQKPSPHTLRTPFFPLDLYKKDVQRAGDLIQRLKTNIPLQELALHYIGSSPHVNCSIIGFSTPEHVEAAVRIAQIPPLTEEEISSLESAMLSPYTSPVTA